MAFGIIQKILWAGSVKYPVPAIVEITNDFAAKKGIQTILLIKKLKEINANLSQINFNLGRTADNLQSITKLVSDLDSSIGVYGISIQQKNSIQAALVTSQIQFDNFFKELNGEKPKLPGIEEQLKELVKESLIFNQITGLQGLINNQINSMVQDMGTWVTGTEAYKGISGWVKNQISSITTPITARSAEFIKSVTQALSGIKAP